MLKKNYKNKMSVESSLNCKFKFKSYTFCLYFILYLLCGSGSIKLMNTDPIRIRIHNTEQKIILTQPILYCIGTVPVQCTRYTR